MASNNKEGYGNWFNRFITGVILGDRRSAAQMKEGTWDGSRNILRSGGNNVNLLNLFEPVDTRSTVVNPDQMDASARELWDQLSAAEQSALKNEYTKSFEKNFGNLWGLLGDDEYVDTEALFADLAEASRYTNLTPDSIRMGDYLGEDAINKRVAELTAGLDELKADREASYLAEMQEIRDMYSLERDALMSAQHRQSAMLADAYQSELARSRRNALEAGASAGLRLADNINVMLANQNKQAQISLDTSNQLAQMLLNRNAASRQAKDSYDNYMREDWTARNAARTQAYDEGRAQYDAAMSDREGKLLDLDRAYGGNPAYKYAQSSAYRAKYN